MNVDFSKLQFVDRLLCCCCLLRDLFCFVGYLELLQCILSKEDFIMAAFQLHSSLASDTKKHHQIYY